MLESAWREVRFASRALIRKPMFTVVAVLSLALGIGANSTIFTILDGLLFRPLAGVENADRLSRVYMTDKSFGWPIGVSYPNLTNIEQATDGLVDSMAGHFTDVSGVSFRGDDPRITFGNLITGDYFTTLGTTPAHGRLLTRADSETRQPVAVLQYGFFQDRFGGDPAVIGESIVLDGQTFTIVGVAEEDFIGTEVLFEPKYWIPMEAVKRIASGTLLEDRGSASISVTARLQDGVALDELETRLAVLSDNLTTEYPDIHKGLTLHAMPDKEARIEAGLGDSMRLISGVLFALVGLVLLIACGNVANLMLARASGRRKDLSIRMAIGAGRAGLIRQQLVESVMVALLGGAVGLGLALLASRFVANIDMPSAMPIRLDVSPSPSILIFTLLVSVAAGLLFGILPAWQASRQDPLRGLKSETGTETGKSFRLGGAFVVTQVAISLVLLFAAGLFLRSLSQAGEVDLGIDPHDVAAVTVDYGMLDRTAEEGALFYQQVRDELASLPGVENVTIASAPPLDWQSSGDRWVFDKDLGDDLGNELLAMYTRVDVDYFETLDTEIVQGRAFSRADTADTEPVVIINQKLASMVWPEENPLGKQIRYGGHDGVPLTVVGVAEDGKYRLPGESQRPYLFVPFQQQYRSYASFLIETDRDPKTLLSQTEDVIHGFVPELAIFSSEPFGFVVESRTMGPIQLLATLATAFGLIGLLLASIGLYGVMAYSVSQRARELGVRIALGASQRQVLGGVLGRGLKLAVIGAVMGGLLAFALGRVLQNLLVGVSASDPATFAAVVATLMVVASLATLIPALRATRIDPVKSLRAE